MNNLLEETYVKMPWHTFHQLLETNRYIAVYTSGLSHLDYDTIMDDLKEIEDETWDVSNS